MMTRRSFHRSDVLWLGLIVAALALPWLLPEFSADVPTDSYRTGPRGKKALYLVADRLGYAVWRNLDSLETFVRQYEGSEWDAVLVLPGPARAPTPAEWEALAGFVARGGALVYAARSDEPVFDAGPFGVKGHEREKAIDSDGKKEPLQVDLGGLTGTFSWQSLGELESAEGEEVVSAGGSVQAVAQAHGDGVAVFVASDRPFDNRTLTWLDNAVLAFRLLERAGYRGEAVFDESLNVAGTPKVVAVLLDRPLRPFTLHLFAVLAAFGWWRSRRFGPLLPPSVGARSDIVAHADAVGMLYYKTRDGRTALRYYLQQLTTELSLRRLSGAREERILEPIARRLGRNTDDVRKAFRQAAAALRQEKLDRVAAARHIRRLAKVRRAARRGTEAGG